MFKPFRVFDAAAQHAMHIPTMHQHQWAQGRLWEAVGSMGSGKTLGRNSRTPCCWSCSDMANYSYLRQAGSQHLRDGSYGQPNNHTGNIEQKHPDWTLSLEKQYSFHVNHIPDTENYLVDNLSRLQVCILQRLAGGAMNAAPTPIPLHLLLCNGKSALTLF